MQTSGRDLPAVPYRTEYTHNLYKICECVYFLLRFFKYYILEAWKILSQRVS